MDSSEVAKHLAQAEQVTVKRLHRLARWVYSELRWLIRVLISSADRFYWDNGFSKAAALAYSCLLSVVPLIALCFGILASFAAYNKYIPGVREFLFRQFIPGDTKTEYVDRALEYLTEFSAALSSLNALVVCFVVITALFLVNSIENALNETWQVYESRPLSHRLAIFSAIILIAPLILFSAYYFTEIRVNQFFSEWESGSAVYQLYRNLLPYFIDFLAFVGLYYFVPKAPVQLRSAVLGAAVAAFLFALAKSSFAVYLADFASYDKVYRALSAISAIPISLFWLYLVWSIVLFGAECSYQSQYLPRTGKLFKRTLLSVGDARIVLAVQALMIIIESFKKGEKLPNDLELAEKLGCSSMVLKPTLDALEKAQLIARGDSRAMPLTLMRTPEMITLAQLREALFGGRASLRSTVQLERLFSHLKNEAHLNKVTLADIV